MTGLEITLIVILWVIVGLWLNFKFSVMDNREQFDNDGLIIPCVMFAPLVLVCTLINQFVFKDWI